MSHEDVLEDTDGTVRIAMFVVERDQERLGPLESGLVRGLRYRDGLEEAFVRIFDLFQLLRVQIAFGQPFDEFDGFLSEG